MTTAEKVELCLIPVLALVFWWGADFLPATLRLGSLFLFCSATFLLQGLFRDIFLLLRRKRNPSVQEEQEEKACMCVESLVGTVGILAGLGLLGLGFSMVVRMQAWSYAVCVLVVMLLGFFLKDYVFSWNPLRLQKEKNHLNVVVRWK